MNIVFIGSTHLDGQLFFSLPWSFHSPQVFKRRLVAFKGGFVGPLVGLSVLKKISKSFEKEVL